ncbi:hypothetical protein AB3R30_03645 [Leptolyngbyaceae cyanobacterium UHCC 1019]
MLLITQCYQMIGEVMPIEVEIRQGSTRSQTRSPFLDPASLGSSQMPNGSTTVKPLGEAQSTSLPIQPEEAKVPTPQPTNICRLALEHNLFTATLAISWIIISSIAFMAPLKSFSAFVTRWFNSDTVAFTTIFLFAGLAAVVLYWLHVFTQILTILAAETLARIDLQTRSVNGIQSFWLLTTVCLIGLGFGWIINTIW